MEALEDGVITVTNPLKLTIEYSKGGKDWSASSASTISIPVLKGDRICFRGDNNCYATSISGMGFSSQYQHTNILPSGRCYVYGNVMSLIDSENYEFETVLSSPNAFVCLFYGATGLDLHPTRPFTLPATTLSENCYVEMFAYTGITRAPELPALVLAQNCYGRMFSHCMGLTEAPALPANTLAPMCYRAMFFYCENLVKAPVLAAKTMVHNCYTGVFYGCIHLRIPPELPATSLARSCYRLMFNECACLEYAPELPAETLKDDCYKQMFKGCYKLNRIHTRAKNMSAKNALLDWTAGVAPQGTFICPVGTKFPRGASGIPEGWSVVRE